MVRNILFVLAIVLGVLCAWLIFTRLFPSEKRRLEWTLEDIRKAVESGDPQRCLAFVSPDYFYDGMDRKALQEFAKSALALSGPMKIKIVKQDAQVLQGNQTGVTASEIVSMPCPGSNLPGPVGTSWNLMFRKEGKDWKVWQIELNSVNGEPIQGLRGLLKLAQ